MAVVSSAYTSLFPRKRESRDVNELRGFSWTPAVAGVTITAEA
jgi:hypothetical protein